MSRVAARRRVDIVLEVHVVGREAERCADDHVAAEPVVQAQHHALTVEVESVLEVIRVAVARAEAHVQETAEPSPVRSVVTGTAASCRRSVQGSEHVGRSAGCAHGETGGPVAQRIQPAADRRQEPVRAFGSDARVRGELFAVRLLELVDTPTQCRAAECREGCGAHTTRECGPKIDMVRGLCERARRKSQDEHDCRQAASDSHYPSRGDRNDRGEVSHMNLS